MLFTTYMGTKYDPKFIDQSNLDIRWIARGLSNILRYGGQRNLKWSVAHHVCLIVELLDCVEGISPRVKLAALHHDDTEAIMGVDIPAPVKALFPNIKEYEEELWEDVLLPWLDLGGLSKEEEAIVKRADVASRAVERLFFATLPGWGLTAKQKADIAAAFVSDLDPGYKLKEGPVNLSDFRNFTSDMIEVEFLRTHMRLKNDCT